MFTDWSQALEAESLPLNPNAARQLAAAARVTARSSHDKDDLGLLLDVLGLPADPDTLTALLPTHPGNRRRTHHDDHSRHRRPRHLADRL